MVIYECGKCFYFRGVGGCLFVGMKCKQVLGSYKMATSWVCICYYRKNIE